MPLSRVQLRSNRTFWLIPFLVSAVFAGGLLFDTMRADSYDMAVFRDAGQKMAAGEAGLYEWATDAGTARNAVFLYPPAFAAMYAPVALLPWTSAYVLWSLVSVWFWYFALYRFGVALGTKPLAKWGAIISLIVLVPVLEDIWAGQINLVLCGLLLLAAAALVRAKNAPAGALIAIAASMKVLPAALLPVLVAHRRYASVAAVLGGLVALALLPVLWLAPHHGVMNAFSLNWEMHVTYLQQLVLPSLGTQQSATALSESHLNVSLPHAFGVWFSSIGMPSGLGRRLGLSVGVLLFAGAVLFVRRSGSDKELSLAGFGLAYAAVTFLNVTTWLLHLTVLSLCVAPALMRILERESPRRWLLAGCAALFLLTYMPTWVVLNPETHHFAIGYMSLSLGTLGLTGFWLCIIRALASIQRSEEVNAQQS